MNYLGNDIVNQLNYDFQNNQNNQYTNSQSKKISKKTIHKQIGKFFENNVLETDITSDSNITCNTLFANSIEIFKGTSLRSYIENIDLLNTNFDIQIKNLDDKDHQWSFFSGTFDFSDDGARATIFGIQHQNETLFPQGGVG